MTAKIRNSKFTIQNSNLIIPLIFVGILLPLPLLIEPLHHDEALYAFWARLIATGIDPMLNSVPVDKPPLFIYLVAILFKTMGVSDIIARLPSLIAHGVSIWLSYRLGRQLYSDAIGLLSATIFALSPFSISFAPTILTDPLMVAFVLAGTLAAAEGKSVWAGVWLSLAVASKQQGLFFAPLVLAFLLSSIRRRGEHTNLPHFGQTHRSAPTHQYILDSAKFFLATAIGIVFPLIWDTLRTQKPGFWLQSSLSYGGLHIGALNFGERLIGFLKLLAFTTDSLPLQIIFGVGLVLLLLARRHLADWLLAVFAVAFVALHALFSFQIWDRYLLGLVPLLAILLARVLMAMGESLNTIIGKIKSLTQRRKGAKDFRLSSFFAFFAAWREINFLSLAIAILTISLLLPGTVRAIHGEYPIGGDHGAFYGTREITAYLRGHVGANTTLYHRWLGAHWQYYLFGFPYDLRNWESADELARLAAARTDGAQYIAFPAWQSTTPVKVSLAKTGLTLRVVFKTYRPDGSPGVFLYRIE